MTSTYAETVNRVSTGSGRKAKPERTPFLKLYGDDFLSGCRKAGMSPEEVGMYIVMLVLEWGDKAPLEDDMRRLSVRCGWDVRVVRRIVNQIVNLGKYERMDGVLRNERMEMEIAAYIEKAKTKNAQRDDTSRVDVAQLPAHPANINAVAKPTLTAHLSEKDKENNDGAPKNAPYAHARQNQNQKQKEEEKIASQQVDGGGLAGLNGSAFPMLESIKGWVTLDDQGARQWLQGTVASFGEEPTKAAFQKLKTDIAEGRIISRPLQVWSTIARDYARRGTSPPARGKPPPDKTALQAQRDKIRAEHGWVEEVTHG